GGGGEAGGGGAEEAHGPAKPGEQRRSVIDPVRAWEEWGWRPQVPMQEGLQRTVDYFRRSRELTGGEGRVRGEGT
ncbi:MAG: hypothetical protein R6W82_00480, partial [bacterium]